MVPYKYTINCNAPIRDALVMLDGSNHDSQTLFVIDDNGVMVGTATDGDIRRGLINGAALTDSVSSVMHTSFKCITL